MSDYTIANLKEIDDSADEHAPSLEARFAPPTQITQPAATRPGI
jgi:hypothetical protein